MRKLFPGNSLINNYCGTASFFYGLHTTNYMSNYSTLQQLMGSFKLCLFFNLGAAENKVQNGIARVLDVDDAGYCWLLFHYPIHEIPFLENEFPARFRLYEKGRDCYIEAGGMAECVTDPAEWSKCPKISYGMAKALRYHGLVIRVAIDKAVVYEMKKYSARGRVKKFINELEELFMGRRINETIYQSSIS